MYYLYLDESGDAGNPRGTDGNFILRSTRYFTLAGIIVDEGVRTQFHSEYQKIMSLYFSKFTLPTNFKLHYNSLRMQKKYPYDQLSQKEVLELEHDIFKTISMHECHLLSVTIDLDYHYRKYSKPIWPVALVVRSPLE